MPSPTNPTASFNRATLIEHIEATYGAQPEYLWKKNQNFAVFRHPHNEKWFAILMDIPKSKLGIPDDHLVDVLNVKLPPEYLGSVLQLEGVYPAYHMNKEHWVSLLLDGTIPDDEVTNFLDESHNLTL